MRNSKLLATLLCILLYSVLRVVTWNYPIGLSAAGSFDWWLSVARQASFYLMSVLLLWEIWGNKALQRRLFAGRFGRPHTKIDFAFLPIAFVLIIGAIAMVILPYRARLERATNLDVSLAAESNTALQGND